MVMGKGRDGKCAWCVASKNYKGYISQSSPSESNRAQRGYP